MRSLKWLSLNWRRLDAYGVVTGCDCGVGDKCAGVDGSASETNLGQIPMIAAVACITPAMTAIMVNVLNIFVVFSFTVSNRAAIRDSRRPWMNKDAEIWSCGVGSI